MHNFTLYECINEACAQQFALSPTEVVNAPREGDVIDCHQFRCACGTETTVPALYTIKEVTGA